VYGGIYFSGMDIDVESSCVTVRKQDRSILQIACFATSAEEASGGWRSILLPEWTYTPADPESVSRVYIYTEDENGIIFEQKPIALRYGTRTILQEDRQVQDVVCFDYAVAEKGSRQWVLICSTLIDDDGNGNAYRLNEEGPKSPHAVLIPYAGYVCVHRDSWFPHSYNESVERVFNDLDMPEIREEIGYTRLFTMNWDTQREYREDE